MSEVKSNRAWRLECESLRKENGRLQARIDALMFEYCPKEMTNEQIERWAAHQVAARSAQEGGGNERTNRHRALANLAANQRRH